MEPVQSAEVDGGAGRWWVWVVRLVVCALAIVLIAVVWHHRAAARSDDAPPPTAPLPSVRWAGATSDGGVMMARTVAGRLVYFSAFLTYRCAGGRKFRFEWRPAHKDMVALRQRGLDVRGHVGPVRAGLGPKHTLWMATLDILGTMGRHPRGTLSSTMVTVPWTSPRPRRWTHASCTTGPVRFALGEYEYRP
jgi:hypothetical protein